jgi:surface polysaccharide O-acyltransferase-like enzyme
MSTTTDNGGKKGLELEKPMEQESPESTNVQRLPFIDSIKALAIFLVVCNHSIPREEMNFLVDGSFLKYFEYYIFTFFGTAVPLFFLVNGMLLLNRPLNIKKHYKKIFHIALIGIIWATLTILTLNYYREHIRGGMDAYPPKDTLRIILSAEGGWLNHLWFIKAFVAIQILVPLLKLAYDYSRAIFLHTFFFVFVFTILLDFILKAGEIFGETYFIKATVADYNIFAYHFSFAFVYFMAGGLFLHYKEKLKTPCFRILSIAGIILATLGSTLCAVWYSRKTGEIYDSVFWEYSSIFKFVAALAVATLFLAYKGTENFSGKLLQTIGINSLGIYFLHVPLQFPIRSLARIISLPNGMLGNLLTAIVTLFISLGLCLVLKKIPVVKELFKI